jgi:hypothetical protein
MINTSLRQATAQASSDEMLVARIAAGDRLAMQTLFARHRTAIYRWLLRFVGNETVAEDLLSNVFLDVWRQAGRFEGRSAVATWLLSIARWCRRSAAGKKYRSHLVELRSFFEITSSSMYALNDLRMLNNLCPIVTSGLEIKRANAHPSGRI